jgi:insertion element IS1 protein InsB
MVIREACPHGGSLRSKKNGHTRPGKQHHPCKACERQFVATAADRGLGNEPRPLMAHLLRERLSRRGICRAMGVRLPWLLPLMVERVAVCPADLQVRIPRHATDVVLRRRAAEAAELWSVVQHKATRQWIGIAMDAPTRQVMACHGGDRSRESAMEWWAKMPRVYQEEALFHPDHYDAYTGVMPAERHTAIMQQARTTHPIERFNNTLSQHVSRLVRETRSCSTRLANHIGAMKYFMCHDNLTRAATAALPV